MKYKILSLIGTIKFSIPVTLKLPSNLFGTLFDSIFYCLVTREIIANSRHQLDFKTEIIRFVIVNKQINILFFCEGSHRSEIVQATVRLFSILTWRPPPMLIGA